MIRDAAMGLFAERGASAVTIREVASAAGVSPGLVMHHFGSKDGLRDAVDRRAMAGVEDMLAELVCIGEAGAIASPASVLAARLEREPVLIGYLRRLLLEGGEAADVLFRRLFETTLAGMVALVAAGVVRPAAADEATRAAFLLVNDLAMIVFRRRIRAATGTEPLNGEGLRLWTATVLDVYRNGIFTAAPPAPSPPAGLRKADRSR